MEKRQIKTEFKRRSNFDHRTFIDFVELARRDLIVHNVRRSTFRRQLGAQSLIIRNDTGELADDWARRHDAVAVQPTLRQPPIVVEVELVADGVGEVGLRSRADLELEHVFVPPLDLEALILFLAAESYQTRKLNTADCARWVKMGV